MESAAVELTGPSMGGLAFVFKVSDLALSANSFKGKVKPPKLAPSSTEAENPKNMEQISLFKRKLV